MKLTILFGGASFEHEISIVSAITIKEKLSGFKLTFIFCDQDHNFYLIESSKMKATTFSKGEYKKMPLLNINHGYFSQKTMLSSKEHKGTVINLIHGGDGEDGGEDDGEEKVQDCVVCGVSPAVQAVGVLVSIDTV